MRIIRAGRIDAAPFNINSTDFAKAKSVLFIDSPHLDHTQRRRMRFPHEHAVKEP